MRPAPVFLLLLATTTSVWSQDSLRVGIEENPPFVVRDGSDWSGDSIRMIEQVAADLALTVSYVEFDTVEELLRAVESGSVDASVSAITMTAARERFVDFSHPYAATYIAALVASDPSWLASALVVVEKVFGALLALVLLLYAVGWIIGRIDRRFENMHHGAWWALVTFSTTGYGDLVPDTGRGRAFASIWIIVSLFVCSLFTGFVASSMTVERLSQNPTTIAQLSEARVVAVADTTADLFLDDLGIEHSTARTLGEALELFFEGDADVVVEDQSLLEYSVDSDEYEIWPLTQRAQYYGIALPQGSPLTVQLLL